MKSHLRKMQKHKIFTKNMTDSGAEAITFIKIWKYSKMIT
jgi:hypothetical protein